ncbi:hypothetical protein K9N50_03900 [bacterium]|nr:hypothetical protein [bacterium]
MKRMSNNNQTNWDDQNDDLGRAVRSLHDPGPARIAASVMQSIRQSDEDIIRLKRRGFAWGLASSFAGMVLGIFLTYTIPESSLIQQTSQSDAVIYTDAASTSDEVLVELTDEFDLLIWEMSNGNEVNNE